MSFSHLHTPSRIFKEDIPTICRIFLRDIKSLLHHPVALIILLGIAFLPSLYAWVNIYANWNPYDNTGNLQVAVANNDAGYSTEGLSVDLGENIVTSLHANDAIGWQFVSEEDAREGVRAGRYYAAVIIPEDFSQDMVTFITGEAQRPTIEYYSNEKKNAIATKITNTGVNTLQNTINEQFVNTISETILDTLNITDHALAEKETAIADHLTGSLETALGNLDDLDVSIGLLIETARAAQELTVSAQALLPDLEGTVGDNIAALENLRLLTQSSDSAADALLDTMDSSTDFLFSACETLYSDASSALDSAQSMSENAASTFAHISAAADSAAGSALRLKNFLVSHESDFLLIAKRQDDIHSLWDKLSPNLPAFSISDTDTLQSRTKAALDTLISLLDRLYGDLKAISRDAGNAAQTIQENGSLPADLLEKLHTDLSALRNDLDAVKNQYQTNTAPLLDESIRQFYVCIDSLVNLLLTTNQNIPQLSTVLTGVDNSLDHSVAALESTRQLLGNARADIQSLLDTLGAVEKDERFAKLLDIIREDPGAVADFLSSPVAVETTQVYPVENYGSAMTPFYSILAIWVGGLLMCSILKTNVGEDEKIKGFGPTTAYFGRYCLFAVVAVMQALIICLGDLYILRIQCLYPLRFVLVGIVAALVYSLMMYTLTVSFKDVGKAIAVIIMVVQVAGSGGTFPVEVLPPFFRIVNPILPFTFCINAMRECIGGLYAGAYAANLLQCCAIYVPISLLIGIVLRRPVILLMSFFEHQVEKTGLM